MGGRWRAFVVLLFERRLVLLLFWAALLERARRQRTRGASRGTKNQEGAGIHSFAHWLDRCKSQAAPSVGLAKDWKGACPRARAAGRAVRFGGV